MKNRDDIVRNAFELFYRQGFHATGVDQLSREGGITKRTLYRYFPTKEELVQATLCHRDERFFARMRERIEREPEALRPAAYVEFIVEWTREAGFHGCAFINAAAEYPDSADAAHAIAAGHKAALRDYLDGLCLAAGLPDAQAKGAALFLIGEGLTVSAQVSGPNETLENEARSMAAALLRG